MTDQEIMHAAITYGIGTMPVLNGSAISQIPENERIVRFVRACASAEKNEMPQVKRRTDIGRGFTGYGEGWNAALDALGL